MAENVKTYIPGHFFVLQFSDIVSGPSHSSPPFLALIFFLLDLIRVPPPQDLSHSWVFQSSHSQCTTASKANKDCYKDYPSYSFLIIFLSFDKFKQDASSLPLHGLQDLSHVFFIPGNEQEWAFADDLHQSGSVQRSKTIERRHV